MTGAQKRAAWEWAAKKLYIDGRILYHDDQRDYVLNTIVPALRKRGANIERRRKKR